MKRVVAGYTLGLLVFVGTVSARELVVEPGGKIATLPAARDAVRALRAAGEVGDVDVVIQNGVYTLDETLIFGLEDSAPAGAVTRYRAADGASPLISGGRVISGWKKSELKGGDIWMAKVPWAHGDAFFHCLYDGSKLLQRARSENFAVSVDAARRKYAGALKNRIEFSFAGEGLKSWKNLEDLEMYGRPTRAWLVNYLGIDSVDVKSRTAKLSVPATYNMFGSWLVENCIDHLDAPGEWVLNSQEGMLYYWPESGTPGDRIIAPALNELIRVEGVNDASLAGTKDQPVEGIVFEGLRLAHADRQQWLPEDKGLQHDWNMWDKANGLVRFRGARNCAVRNCTFSDSGSDGVRLDLFCQHIKVEGSTFKDLGGTGILLCGYGPGKKDVNRKNIIHNNEITRVGQLFLHSPGIFVWQSGHNRISNNHIYDQAYTGLVVAGVRRRFFAPTFEKMGVENPYISKWAFPEGTREHIPTIWWDEISLNSATEWAAFEPYMHARGNIIEYNEVHDCLKLLHDGNCIYLSANGDGNIVRYNVTYNHPQGAMIRTDDDSHGAVVSHNLMFGTMGQLKGIAIKGLNSSQHNIYVNCSMTTGGAGNTIDPKSEMSRNVFYFTKGNTPFSFHTKIERVGSGLDSNVYWHEGGKAEQILAAQRKKGVKNKIDERSVAADPMFSDPVYGDFSFKAGSPATELGIEPMPLEMVAKMGTTRDPFLKRFAAGMPLKVHHETHAKKKNNK
ncbi:right-handed parallel beta-helix repeat-containing protein [Pontiellaceae bacterium B12227]|nr:right-handed parallel beta-helix repeat-containing protein [Pontiellaceae bacterium B12227]